MPDSELRDLAELVKLNRLLDAILNLKIDIDIPSTQVYQLTNFKLVIAWLLRSPEGERFQYIVDDLYKRVTEHHYIIGKDF